MARGRTIDEILENGAAVQRALQDVQLRTEAGLPAIDVSFLDRALPDCLTFHRFFGLNLNDILAHCLHHRYASVFVLDRLPIQRDGLRIQDDALASFLDEWLARDYSALGYSVVRVPVLPPQERLAFILGRLSEQGLI
jgi:predicted ATPase